MKATLLIIATMLWLALIVATLRGHDANNYTHCAADGWCVDDCNPTTGYVAQAEDNPCWLIQSPDSDWQAPTFARSVKDYRS